MGFASSRFLSAFIVLLVGLSLGPSLWAQSAPRQSVFQKTLWVAYILRKPSPPIVSQLAVPDAKIPVFLAPKEGRLRPMVEARFKYDRPGWTLIMPNGQPVEKDQAPNVFIVYAYLNGKLNELFLTVRGPQGEVETERVFIFAPDAQEFKLLSPWDEILVSVGLANLIYSQTNFGKFTALTGIIGANYVTPNRTSRLGAIVNFDMTMLTIQTSPIYRSPQIIESKLDGTYLLNPNLKSPWRSHLLLGASYLTMISNNSPFGFSNLIAPEIGFRGRRIYSSQSALITELRYVAVGKSLTQRGIDFNIGWNWMLSNLHRAEIGMGVSSFKYAPDAETKIESNLISLHLGYSI